MKTLYFVIFTLLLGSCSHPWEKEMAEIDEMITVLDDAEKQLNALDSTNLREIHSKYDANVRYLKHYYQPNVIDTVFAKAMVGYKGVKGIGRKFFENIQLAKDEIAFSRKNLAALKESLEAKKFTDEEANSYLKDERQAIGEIVTGIAMMINSANLAAQMFEQYHPIVEAEIAKIKASNPEGSSND